MPHWTNSQLRLTVLQFLELDACAFFCEGGHRSPVGAEHFLRSPYRRLKARGLIQHSPKRDMTKGMVRHWITRKGLAALVYMRTKPDFVRAAKRQQAKDDRRYQREHQW